MYIYIYLHVFLLPIRPIPHHFYTGFTQLAAIPFHRTVPAVASGSWFAFFIAGSTRSDAGSSVS